MLGYHLVGILLHAGAAVMVALILRRLTIPGADLAAAVFALHPVQVESVAWITEQKNTLSAVFYLGAMFIYLCFDRSRKTSLYGWALALFALGLLSKTVTATLPAALLVIFWWQRRPTRVALRNVRPLLPFFVLGLLTGVFTAWAERTLIGAEGAEFEFSLVDHCLIAGRVIWFYLGKLVWPAELMFSYPLARQPGAMVAVSLSGGGAGVVGGGLASAAAVARTAGGTAVLRGHALSGVGVLQRVPIHLFLRGRSFSVPGEFGGDYACLGRYDVVANAMGAMVSSGRLHGVFVVVGDVGNSDVAAEPDLCRQRHAL